MKKDDYLFKYLAFQRVNSLANRPRQLERDEVAAHHQWCAGSSAKG